MWKRKVLVLISALKYNFPKAVTGTQGEENPANIRKGEHGSKWLKYLILTVTAIRSCTIWWI